MLFLILYILQLKFYFYLFYSLKCTNKYFLILKRLLLFVILLYEFILTHSVIWVYDSINMDLSSLMFFNVDLFIYFIKWHFNLILNMHFFLLIGIITDMYNIIFCTCKQCILCVHGIECLLLYLINLVLYLLLIWIMKKVK